MCLGGNIHLELESTNEMILTFFWCSFLGSLWIISSTQVCKNSYRNLIKFMKFWVWFHLKYFVLEKESKLILKKHECWLQLTIWYRKMNENCEFYWILRIISCKKIRNFKNLQDHSKTSANTNSFSLENMLQTIPQQRKINAISQKMNWDVIKVYHISLNLNYFVSKSTAKHIYFSLLCRLFYSFLHFPSTLRKNFSIYQTSPIHGISVLSPPLICLYDQRQEKNKCAWKYPT